MKRLLLALFFLASARRAGTVQVDALTTLLDSSTFTPGAPYMAVFQFTGGGADSRSIMASNFDLGGGLGFGRVFSDPTSGDFFLGQDDTLPEGIWQTNGFVQLGVTPANNYALYSQGFMAGTIFSFDYWTKASVIGDIPDQFAFQLYDAKLTTLLYETAIDVNVAEPTPEAATAAMTLGGLALLMASRRRT